MSKVYVTGKIEGMTKKEVQALVESYGYEWSSSITGTLDLLVLGEKAGPKKIEKAKELGIRTLSWDDFKASLS